MILHDSPHGRRVHEFLVRYANSGGLGTWLFTVSDNASMYTRWRCQLCVTVIHSREQLLDHAKWHVRLFGDSVYALVAAGEIDYALGTARELCPERFL